MLDSHLIGLMSGGKRSRQGHTGRFSGTVLDRGSVGNTNPRPPLDKVGAMRIAEGYTVSKLKL